MSRLKILLIVCVVLSACTHIRAMTSHRYFPLKQGNAWVYDIKLDGKPSGHILQVLVSDVVNEPSGQVFVVSEIDESLEPHNRHDQPTTYQSRNTGIFCQESGAYVLPSSLANCQTWQAGPLNTAGMNRVISVDASLEAAGQYFEGCLVVERKEPQFNRRIEFTFASEVGLLRSRFFKLSDSGVTLPYREEILIEFGHLTPHVFCVRRISRRENLGKI